MHRKADIKYSLLTFSGVLYIYKNEIQRKDLKIYLFIDFLDMTPIFCNKKEFSFNGHSSGVFIFLENLIFLRRKNCKFENVERDICQKQIKILRFVSIDEKV